MAKLYIFVVDSFSFEEEDLVTSFLGQKRQGIQHSHFIQKRM